MINNYRNLNLSGLATRNSIPLASRFDTEQTLLAERPESGSLKSSAARMNMELRLFLTTYSDRLIR